MVKKMQILRKIKIFLKSSYKHLLILSILIALFYIKLPFVIYTPGGVVALESRIDVEESYDIKGSINMNYVSVVKGTIPMILASFVIPDWDLMKEEEVTNDSESIADLLKIEKVYMESSINNATILAYTKAGKDIKITKQYNTITYISTEANTNALKTDELISVDGNTINSIEELKSYIQTKNVGDKITLLVKRDGKEKECYAIIYDDGDSLKVGIAFLTTYSYETDPKISIKTKSSESGSSGGLMLSLGIYNAITEYDITKGRTIVGTGTIDEQGNVGAIDGIKYKILGAVKNNADIYLCPVDNYEEAMQVKEEYNLDLPIYSVSTFDEALSILEEK
jgi:PDZ domain-containing protein